MLLKKSVVLLCLIAASISLSAKKPNIVLVITDDQGYGDLSCTGNPILKTPHLDTLHAESVRLTDFHVSPTCAPTRGALLSSHYTNRAGPWHTILGRSFLKTSSKTIAEILSSQGYATGLFGKWHLGDNYPYRPQDRGFQEVVSHAAGGVGQTPDYWNNDYFDDVYMHNGEPTRFEGYCTDVFFREAKRFIEQQAESDKPFFAYISTNAPHSPFVCPDDYWKPYKKYGLTDAQAIFFGMIANIDENVGQLRKWLADEGLEQNTIFIFMTDNGTATGRPIYNAGMRGGKGSEYEGGHRVPFFIYWPKGEIYGGRDIDSLTAHIDIMPTLLDLCGISMPMSYAIDGRSLTPLLYDLPFSWPDRSIIVDSQRVVDPIKWKNSAVMTERWRLINGKELYDISADPDQENDIASEYPKALEKLRQDYEDWWADISPSFADESRVIIGHPAENPIVLTSHDWITTDRLTPWNQTHIRQAKEGTGAWHLRVHQTGKYRIRLFRWPPEANASLGSSLPAGEPVSGLKAYSNYEGIALPITQAIIKVGDVTLEKAVSPDAHFVEFDINLAAGKVEFYTEFHFKNTKKPAISAYYAEVKAL